MKRLGLVIFALAAFWPESASACVVPGIRTLDNQTVPGFMRVKSGRPCSIVMRWSSGPIDKVAIVQRPSHGNVTIKPPGKIFYQSRSGFVGNDKFT